jgi:hypothetical protein
MPTFTVKFQGRLKNIGKGNLSLVKTEVEAPSRDKVEETLLKTYSVVNSLKIR